MVRPDSDKPMSRATARRVHVLRAVVDDYVNSREPVGSAALVERHNLGVSAATIRNDMAVLEEQGLIEAPHTSAGRIPTEQGYRYFVDRIEDIKPLSAAERRAIHQLLEGAEELDDVLARTARALSALTQQVAVIQIPKDSNTRIRHVEILTMRPGQVLVVVIASNGDVTQRMVPAPHEVSDVDVALVRDQIAEHIVGKPLHAVTGVLTSVSSLPPGDPTGFNLPRQLLDFAHTVARAIASALTAHQVDRVVLSGTANLARSQQDFRKDLTGLLETLEEQVVLLRLLSEMEADDDQVVVRIGSENTHAELTDTSVVASSYGANGSAMLGVLGPTRMDYSGSMGAVRAIARYLSRILSS